MAKNIKSKKALFILMMKNLALIIIGSVLYGIAISLFLDPNNLAPGGITGISVMLNRFLPFRTGTLYLILNIPIILIGLWQFGIRFLIKTIISILTTSFFTNLFGAFEVITREPLIAAVSGGAAMALGIGLIFRAGATTGGTDIIVKILRRKKPHLKTGFLFLASDCLIVAVSGFVFRNYNVVFYAMVSVVISGWLLDKILYGGDEARQIFIISEEPFAIANRLLHEVNAGCTYLEGKGAYTNRPKKVLLCVVSKRVCPEVENIVKEEDPGAFMIIGSANEIYGDGYKDILADRL